MQTRVQTDEAQCACVCRQPETLAQRGVNSFTLSLIHLNVVLTPNSNNASEVATLTPISLQTEWGRWWKGKGNRNWELLQKDEQGRPTKTGK